MDKKLIIKKALDMITIGSSIILRVTKCDSKDFSYEDSDEILFNSDKKSEVVEMLLNKHKIK